MRHLSPSGSLRVPFVSSPPSGARQREHADFFNRYIHGIPLIRTDHSRPPGEFHGAAACVQFLYSHRGGVNPKGDNTVYSVPPLGEKSPVYSMNNLNNLGPTVSQPASSVFLQTFHVFPYLRPRILEKRPTVYLSVVISAYWRNPVSFSGVQYLFKAYGSVPLSHSIEIFVRERRQATEGSAGRCECTIGAKPRSWTINADVGKPAWRCRCFTSHGSVVHAVPHDAVICRLMVSLLSRNDSFESTKTDTRQPALNLALLNPFRWPQPIYGPENRGFSGS